MSNIAKAEIILFRPEKRHAVEAFALAQHIARCRLALPLRHHPVLDPYVLTCEWVGPTCDIADGINARSTGPKKCIHSNTAFDDEAGLLRKRQCGSNTNADDHKIRVDLFAACENDTDRKSTRLNSSH